MKQYLFDTLFGVWIDVIRLTTCKWRCRLQLKDCKWCCGANCT